MQPQEVQALACRWAPSKLGRAAAANAASGCCFAAPVGGLAVLTGRHLILPTRLALTRTPHPPTPARPAPRRWAAACLAELHSRKAAGPRVQTSRQADAEQWESRASGRRGPAAGVGQRCGAGCP